MRSIKVKMVRFHPGVLETIEDSIVTDSRAAVEFFPAIRCLQITYLTKQRDPDLVPCEAVKRMVLAEPLPPETPTKK